jgi:hypothetical protein
VRRFLKAYVEAIHLVKTNSDISKKAFAKYRQTKDEKRIEDAYQALRETVRPKPYPSIEGFSPSFPTGRVREEKSQQNQPAGSKGLHYIGVDGVSALVGRRQ